MAEELDDSQVASRWAALIVEAADQHEAWNFAWSMAEFGCVPENIRMLAERWREGELQPNDFANSLDLFADAVEEASGTRHRAFR